MKENFERKIYPEQVKLLFQQITFAIFAESLAALGFTAALWGAVNKTLLIIWLVSNLLFCGLARHVMVYCYKKSTAHSELTYEKASFWLILFTIGAFLSGVSWGITGSFLMVEGDMVRQTFEVFLLIGVTAAANPFYSPIKRVYTIFLLPAFVPFAVWLMYQGGIFIILGILALIYIGIMLATSFYSARIIAISLALRFENTDLVESLSSTNKELEDSVSLISHQAHFDTLTNLPNRTLVLDRISQAISYTERTNKSVGILFVDLDRFKNINDTLGHTYGDNLLKAVANRLLECTRSNDTVSRTGGDEFIIVITLLKSENDCAAIAKHLIKAFNEPFIIDDHKFIITISIGISLYPRDGSGGEELIKNADIAMYRAKESGRNQFQFYTEEMNSKIHDRLKIENELRDALVNNELSVLYQPIVSLRSGRMIGVEALLRWDHPELGAIPPEKFISIAEESGMIIQIGEWILKTACIQMKQFQKMGFEHLYVSVNLSARQFKQANLYERISSILNEIELDPEKLSLELTESVIMDDVEKNLVTLHQLKKLGVMIAIDDFGIGYSSLNYLKRLPVDKLKIDISFVRDIEKYADGAAITAAIIALAAKLNLTVIAEGVENTQQIEFLVHHHCDEIQGFYFSHPLTSEEFFKILAKNPVLSLPYTIS